MGNAIKIKLTRAAASEESLSHLFGSPVIPESLEEALNELDGDVLFFGQFDLSHLAPYDIENRLPHHGYLYLFLDTAMYPYEAHTMYSEDEPAVVMEDFNSEVTDFERFTTPFAMRFEAVAGDTEGTKLFGAPSWEWDSEETLFMQFDPLDNETGFLNEIDGYAFFTFDEERGNIEDLHFIIDRS